MKLGPAPTWLKNIER